MGNFVPFENKYFGNLEKELSEKGYSLISEEWSGKGMCTHLFLDLEKEGKKYIVKQNDNLKGVIQGLKNEPYYADKFSDIKGIVEIVDSGYVCQERDWDLRWEKDGGIAEIFYVIKEYFPGQIDKLDKEKLDEMLEIQSQIHDKNFLFPKDLWLNDFRLDSEGNMVMVDLEFFPRANSDLKKIKDKYRVINTMKWHYQKNEDLKKHAISRKITIPMEYIMGKLRNNCIIK